MKKKAIGTLLALMTMAALTSCGAKNESTEVVAMERNVTIETETGLIVEDVPMIPETIKTEEPVYIDYEDLYLADNYLKVDREKLEAVDTNSLKETFEDYVLSESVDLYNFEGTWVGYSKPDIRVTLFGTNDKWAEVSFTRVILYIPRDNFDLVAMIPVEEPETEEVLLAEAEETTPKQETTPSKPKTETSAPVTTEPVVAEPSTTEHVVVEPETPVVDNTKYTPEEAIAVYRSIMESNGIQWNPSIKEFASWGTGWIYLTKGQPEWAGNSSVESYRMGDGDGIPWRNYYLEVTGSDENAVYITKWHCR